LEGHQIFFYEYYKAVLAFPLRMVLYHSHRKEIPSSQWSITMDLKNMSYSDLAKLQDEVNAEANAKRTEARATALASIVSMITEFAFVGADINKALGITGKTKKTKGAATAKGKAEPKYRDPVTGAMWSGRGVSPAWIKGVAKEDRGQYLIVTGSSEASTQPIPASEPEAVTGEADEPAVEVEAGTAEEAPTDAPASLFSKAG